VKVLSLDPGVTTGMCFGVIEADSKLVVTPKQERLIASGLWRVLETWEPQEIVCESFEFRKQSRQGLVLDSVKFIGVTELYAQLNGARLHGQMAAHGKSYYTDAKLKQLAIYVPGLPHGMDALRHLLHWYTFGSGYKYNQQKELKVSF
jgi:hypothetical protein